MEQRHLFDVLQSKSRRLPHARIGLAPVRGDAHVGDSRESYVFGRRTANRNGRRNKGNPLERSVSHAIRPSCPPRLDRFTLKVTQERAHQTPEYRNAFVASSVAGVNVLKTDRM
jgi:hypothetical protein